MFVLRYHPNTCFEGVRKTAKKLRITSSQTSIENQNVPEVIPQFSAYTISGLQFLVCIQSLYFFSLALPDHSVP
jgi:hypothetical protein